MTQLFHRTPPFLTWARPIFEQGALSPMSVFPADFPVVCLPGDKLFQSKEVADGYCLPPIVLPSREQSPHGTKVTRSETQRSCPIGSYPPGD